VALTLPTLLTKSETQKQASKGATGAEIAARMTATYIAGPIAAFNYVVEHPGVSQNQSNKTFAEILTPLRAVGVRYVPPPHFEPFLPIPFLFNVFTVYRTFYGDYGVAGCLVAMLLCGIISGSLFHAAIHGNKFAAFAFCYIGYAIIMSPFLNNFNLFSRYVYIALFGIAYFVVAPRLPHFTLFDSRGGAQGA
jgi:oligosaccharide repeat unit polymerase